VLEAADKVSRNELKNSFARAATFDDELSDKRGDETKSGAPRIVPRLVESLGADSMDFCVGGKGAMGKRVEAILQVCHQSADPARGLRLLIES
jgi:hypothetical protein